MTPSSLLEQLCNLLDHIPRKRVRYSFFFLQYLKFVLVSFVENVLTGNVINSH